MPMPWFRVYAAMRHDPKVKMLSYEMRCHLMDLWCIACENDGKLPDNSVISFELRLRSDKVCRVINTLISAGLIDQVGDHLEPHNWAKRQYKSDTSNERVARYRERHRNANVTLQETFPVTEMKRAQIQTTESSSSVGESLGTPLSLSQEARMADPPKKRMRPSEQSDEAFEEFRKAFPKREGGSPRAPALKAFNKARASGADLEAIIGGTRRFAADCNRRQVTGTRFIPHASTWLNERRWEDYQPETPRMNGHAVKRERTPEQIAIDQEMAKRGAELFDEFGYIKSSVG